MRRAPIGHPFLVTAACLAFLVSLSSGAASAAGPERERGGRSEAKVQQVLKLQPEPGAEVIVPEFKAYFLSDGSVTVSGKGSARAGAPVQGFDFEVNLQSGTYATRRLEGKEIEDHSPPPRMDQPDPPAEESFEKAIMPGNWTGRVRVQTKDPVFVVLTETTAGLTWNVSSTGSVTALSYVDNCWAANPSSLGTHWYTSFCLGGAPYASSGRVCNTNQGDYYNYDFASADQITTATQTAYVCGRNDAFYDYNWSHNDGGEASLLIYGSVIVG